MPACSKQCLIIFHTLSTSLPAVSPCGELAWLIINAEPVGSPFVDAVVCGVVVVALVGGSVNINNSYSIRPSI